MNWQALVEAGTISPQDLELMRFVENADETDAIIDAWKDSCDDGRGRSGADPHP